MMKVKVLDRFDLGTDHFLILQGNSFYGKVSLKNDQGDRTNVIFETMASVEGEKKKIKTVKVDTPILGQELELVN